MYVFIQGTPGRMERGSTSQRFLSLRLFLEHWKQPGASALFARALEQRPVSSFHPCLPLTTANSGRCCIHKRLCLLLIMATLSNGITTFFLFGPLIVTVVFFHHLFVCGFALSDVPSRGMETDSKAFVAVAGGNVSKTVLRCCVPASVCIP